MGPGHCGTAQHPWVPHGTAQPPKSSLPPRRHPHSIPLHRDTAPEETTEAVQPVAQARHKVLALAHGTAHGASPTAGSTHPAPVKIPGKDACHIPPQLEREGQGVCVCLGKGHMAPVPLVQGCCVWCQLWAWQRPPAAMGDIWWPQVTRSTCGLGSGTSWGFP